MAGNRPKISKLEHLFDYRIPIGVLSRGDNYQHFMGITCLNSPNGTVRDLIQDVSLDCQGLSLTRDPEQKQARISLPQ